MTEELEVPTRERDAVYFIAPRQVAVRREPLPPLAASEALVETVVSGISAGTEMLLYRGEMPPGMAADSAIEALQGELRYPLKYGYAAVGRVAAVGAAVERAWLGRLVLAFHPHESHFAARPDQWMALPEGISAESATLLPNLETAVSLVMDGRPVIGERVAVLGQGVVGLLVTWLLGQFPLAELVTVDKWEKRRKISAEFGATLTLSPDAPLPTAFDLVYELSGQPAALNQAIALTGYAGRIVIGSWYGRKQAPLDLGSHFHRSHIQLISSQVSSLAPIWRGRWDHVRRLDVAWRSLRRLPADRLITHRFPLAQAAQAYRRLDRQPHTLLHTLLTYD